MANQTDWDAWAQGTQGETLKTNTMKKTSDKNITKSAMTQEPLLISVNTVARMLSISTRQIWRLRDAGDMPQPLKLGRAVRWRSDEIAAWVRDGCPPIQQERRRV